MTATAVVIPRKCKTAKTTPKMRGGGKAEAPVVEKKTGHLNLAVGNVQRNSAEMAVRNSPDCFSPCTSAMANSPKPSRAPSANGGLSNKQQSKLTIRRRPVPFRDALVVRSAAKKMVVNVNGVSFTVTEFKPRTSPRGRKKLPVNQNNGKHNVTLCHSQAE
ncbi:hypothetical protein niasHS_002137 [Heterodera schachtii]|uniref:Uncharacterized protein n=1 Tax=Heterodera schachtii TaxID=97005 RepID=A0ABD2KNC4_HETSC